MNIISLAARMLAAAMDFKQHARRFYYAVTLLGRRCPKCNGKLSMIKEGECRCTACSHGFDPTPIFQNCSACGGQLELRVRRYRCRNCHADADSMFLFDGLVFDTEYFRQRMVEHRRRKHELRERVRQLLTESRSCVLQPCPADLNAVPGLTDALNSLTAGIELSFNYQPRASFDLKRYQAHVQAHIRPIATTLDQIPPLSENTRIDRIWRFVAIIFLAHAGQIKVWQDGRTVMVIQRETNREGQDVPGEPEAADGIERSVGRVEA